MQKKIGHMWVIRTFYGKHAGGYLRVQIVDSGLMNSNTFADIAEFAAMGTRNMLKLDGFDEIQIHFSEIPESVRKELMDARGHSLLTNEDQKKFWEHFEREVAADEEFFGSGIERTQCEGYVSLRSA
jgi:hypothetical protein